MATLAEILPFRKAQAFGNALSDSLGAPSLSRSLRQGGVLDLLIFDLD
jgi:hypothetical protein